MFSFSFSVSAERRKQQKLVCSVTGQCVLHFDTKSSVPLGEGEEGSGRRKGRERKGRDKGGFKRAIKGGHAPKMLIVALLCTFAYGVQYSVVDLNYHYHKH